MSSELSTTPFPPDASAAKRVPKRALVLPGRAYPIDAPLLFWTAFALVQDGWHVQAVRWQPAECAGAEFVSDALELVEREAPAADVTLLVAKSLGTLAAPTAAAQRLPAVWLTPVLTDPAVAEALASYPAEQLVVGGSADRLWPPDAVVAGETMYVEGADHAMHCGGMRDSMGLHADVAERVVEFARGLVG